LNYREKCIVFSLFFIEYNLIRGTGGDN
jgi:hypothetical protein